MNKNILYVIADVLEFCVCDFLLFKTIERFNVMSLASIVSLLGLIGIIELMDTIDVCKRIERAINKSNK